MKLEEWRNKNRISQKLFAEMIGKKSNASIWNYEHGVRPTYKVMQKIKEVTKNKVTEKDWS